MTDKRTIADLDPAAAPLPAERRLEGGTMTDLSTRLTNYLNRVERDMSFPNSVPRDAATLIVIDRKPATPKVLLGRRHQTLKFLPGKFVFPGGRIEPNDRLMPGMSELDPRVEARLMQSLRRPSRHKARAFALAAIRETFEETGLALGQRGPEGDRVPEGHWSAFAATGIRPDLAAMHLVARAITPPRRPRRFDTRFFAVDAEEIAGRVEGVVGPDSELVELVWLPITDAARLDMPGITTAVIEELAQRIAAGFSHDLPVPFYQWIGRRFTRREL